MKFLSEMSPEELAGKRILLRADFNVPIKDGKVSDDSRIQKTLPTIQKILENGASLAICSHLGRPGGKPNVKYSLKPVADHLQSLLGKKVNFFSNPLENKYLEPGDIILLQNTRFFEEETQNNTLFAGALARGCDFFVNDAFGTTHRAHASTVGVAGLLPHAAGLLVEQEIRVLEGVLKNPEKPLTVITGGAKMKTKIGVLEHFATVADNILLGGGIANTFLAAQGFEIGDSLFEATEIEHAKKIMDIAQKNRCEICLPSDVVVSQEVSETAETRICSLSEITPEEKILDMGTETLEKYKERIVASNLCVWNGPLGLFELSPFATGTREIAKVVHAAKKAVLGGGDTLDAVAKFGFSEEDFFHCSTGGGAMLCYLEGDEMPAIEALR